MFNLLAYERLLFSSKEQSDTLIALIAPALCQPELRNREPNTGTIFKDNMSLPGQEGAERKFWRTADLVESLLLFLDARSTLTLVKVLPLALDIIQMKSMWNKLVKRVCPYDTRDVVSEQ